MGRNPKVAKLDHGVNAGDDDLTESLNDEHDDLGDLISSLYAKDSGKQRGLVIRENTDAAEQLNSSKPSSSKQTLEQKVEFLVQSFKSFQAPEQNYDYKSLYLQSQKEIKVLARDNHILELKLDTVTAKVEEYDKMLEDFGNAKDWVVVSQLTKGAAAEQPLNASEPGASLPRATGRQGTTSAVAAEPGASDLRRSKRGK